MTSDQYVNLKTRNDVRAFAKQRAHETAKRYTDVEVDALGGFLEKRKEAERLARTAATDGGFPVHETETFIYEFTDAVVSAWRTSAHQQSMLTPRVKA